MSPSASTILIIAFSVVGVILVAAGWYYLYRMPRDRNAPHRLGQEMGLSQLNPGSREVPVWYGGRRREHDYGLTYANLRYSSYGKKPARAVEDVILSLRLAVALNTPQAQDIIAYFHHGREFQAGLLPPDFDYAFDRRNVERLSQASRDAMLAFVQQYGSLRLRDRATAPDALFAAEALPQAHVVLVHDRPGHNQSAQEVQDLLDALLDLADQLERDPAYALSKESSQAGAV